MPLLNLLHRKPLPNPTQPPSSSKSWQSLDPLLTNSQSPVPLPTFTFDPNHTSPNIIISLLPDPVPFLERASAYILSYLESAKDPPVRAVELRLSKEGGVAATVGGVVTLFLPYFEGYGKTHTPEETLHEIMGVVLHELVHVYQHDGHHTVPGGLIEGVADFLRLRAGLAPPHWKRTRGGTWDAGYERTAFFLEWIESEKEGFVRGLNAECREKYQEDRVWRGLTGKGVGQLWGEWQAVIPSGVEEGAPPAVPTEAAAPGAWRE